MEILLSSTLHDPKGVFSQDIKQVSQVVLRDYKGWVINVTKTTNQNVKDEILRLQGDNLYMTESENFDPLVSDKVENDHLYLLSETSKIAGDLKVRKIQYTDGDRIIVAAKYFPLNLANMAHLASESLGEFNSYLNFRRSPEDYFTHHPPLVQTELEFNRLYSKVFGIPLDIGSTAHAFSLDVLENILIHSPKMESVSFPHPKWLIIAKEMGAHITSAETHHVLTFETPEQFRKEMGATATDEDYSSIQKNYMATFGRLSTLSSREWQLRFGTEKQYLAILKNHLDKLDLRDELKDELNHELEISLSNLEGRQKAILEALEQSGKKPEQ